MTNKEQLVLGAPVAWRWKWHTFSEWQYGKLPNSDTTKYYKLQPLYLNPVETKDD